MERERAYQQVKSGIDADRERRLLQEALERDRAFQQARSVTDLVDRDRHLQDTLRARDEAIRTFTGQASAVSSAFQSALDSMERDLRVLDAMMPLRLSSPATEFLESERIAREQLESLRSALSFERPTVFREIEDSTRRLQEINLASLRENEFNAGILRTWRDYDQTLISRLTTSALADFDVSAFAGLDKERLSVVMEESLASDDALVAADDDSLFALAAHWASAIGERFQSIPLDVIMDKLVYPIIVGLILLTITTAINSRDLREAMTHVDAVQESERDTQRSVDDLRRSVEDETRRQRALREFVVIEAVIVRERPTRDAAKIGMLEAGTAVEELDRGERGWRYVRIDGEKGGVEGWVQFAPR